MIWETHLLGAVVLGIVGVELGFFHPGFYFVFGLLLGALLPDIDSPRSKLGRKVRPISDIIGFFAGHRGLMHSILGLLIIFVPLYLVYAIFAKNIAIPFLFGYLSHLVLDSLTPRGVRPLYPSRFRIKGPIKTNSWFERIVFIILLAVGLYFVYF